jgi:hypothetical protein
MSWRERARKLREPPSGVLPKPTEAPFGSSVSDPEDRSPPSPVTCGDCRHFQRDPINPGAGIGRCSLALPFRPGERSRWPMTDRYCPEWATANNPETAP